MPTSVAPLISFRPVQLRDGGAVALRSVGPFDRPELLLFLKSLSARSAAMRFCSGGADMGTIASDFTQVGAHRQGIVALGPRGEIVGHAEYLLINPTTAEVAVVVADALQGQGLATAMLERLAALAADHGISRFVAEVLSGNEAMMAVFTRRFAGAVTESESGYSVEFGIGAQIPLGVAA